MLTWSERVQLLPPGRRHRRCSYSQDSLASQTELGMRCSSKAPADRPHVRTLVRLISTPPWRIWLKARVDLDDQTVEFIPFEVICTAFLTYFYLFLGINLRILISVIYASFQPDAPGRCIVRAEVATYFNVMLALVGRVPTCENLLFKVDEETSWTWRCSG